MRKPSSWGRTAIGSLALIVMGCGAPAGSMQAPVPAGQAGASQATYTVQQHARRSCRAEYRRCLAESYRSGYWFFRRVRCTRDYRECLRERDRFESDEDD